MEKRRKFIESPSYDRRRRMVLQHPIDAEIRARLRTLAPNQIELAKRLGRSQGWVNKYLNGAGHATIDDVIRIGAILIGVDPPRLTDAERRLLRAFRRLPVDRQQDAVDFLEGYARRHPRSAGRAGRTGRASNHKGPGTR
jgi:transcriptional regulator with XRE-family HTH domain